MCVVTRGVSDRRRSGSPRPACWGVKERVRSADIALDFRLKAGPHLGFYSSWWDPAIAWERQRLQINTDWVQRYRGVVHNRTKFRAAAIFILLARFLFYFIFVCFGSLKFKLKRNKCEVVKLEKWNLRNNNSKERKWMCVWSHFFTAKDSYWESANTFW